MVAFINANWSTTAQQGKPLSVMVSEYKRKRNVEQNKLLHALLANISENAWVDNQQFSAETWKEAMKRRFIGIEEIELPGGHMIEQGISTTTLSVPDFATFIDQITNYAAQELGIEL